MSDLQVFDAAGEASLPVLLPGPQPMGLLVHTQLVVYSQGTGQLSISEGLELEVDDLSPETIWQNLISFHPFATAGGTEVVSDQVAWDHLWSQHEGFALVASPAGASGLLPPRAALQALRSNPRLTLGCAKGYAARALEAQAASARADREACERHRAEAAAMREEASFVCVCVCACVHERL